MQSMAPLVPSVLVVDDFLDGREMVAEYLAFRGFTVLQAATGAEAIELARRHRPRLILMDLGMPGLDGWEATRQLKADARTSDCVIIALTAHALKAEHVTALRAGCDDVLAKPFDLATLADKVDRIVNTGSRLKSKRHLA
jgi:two-component system cell cycle response regulator DivK